MQALEEILDYAFPDLSGFGKEIISRANTENT